MEGSSEGVGERRWLRRLRFVAVSARRWLCRGFWESRPVQAHAAVRGLEPGPWLPLNPALQGPLFKGVTGSQPERSTGGKGGLA